MKKRNKSMTKVPHLTSKRTVIIGLAYCLILFLIDVVANWIFGWQEFNKRYFVRAILVSVISAFIFVLIYFRVLSKLRKEEERKLWKS